MHKYDIAYALLNDNLIILGHNASLLNWIFMPSSSIVADSLVGQNLADYLPELIGTKDAIGEQLYQGETFSLSKIHRDSEDELGRYGDLYLRPIGSASEQDILLVISDVTEQAHLEQMLRQERNELRLNVEQRIMAEAKLKEYAHELESKNSALDAFAHTVAHDLKNPLGVIISYADILSYEADSAFNKASQEKVKQFCQSIQSTAWQMNSIIQELLLLASLDKEEIEYHPLDNDYLIRSAKNRLTNVIDEAKAKIISPPSWDTAWGYGPWIEEIWTNYISNAIKYGGTPPYIELGSTPHENNTVSFWVKDNGTGLSIEQQQTLFDQFTRFDHSKAEGHGLGLSIVKRIADKLGGSVGVNSEEGQGATFYFILPSDNPDAE
ncbi:HAMP domain-containing sensor histidine kinase [Anaerolineales bacterium HSG6]|nr:HAMP domain-containing sensor histidine kinase [Anaerolineales bacterium HSG6]MDM8532833.1 HAMP domain-containing sensor histidine kinase [Anaerolineales bacterium HSG25]